MSSAKEILQAIKDKNINLLDKLIAQADLNFYDPSSNEDTPLHEAVKVGSEDIVKSLLGKNSKINALNKFNNTPLHLAAIASDINIVKILIAHGADVDIKNNNNKSPLDLAMETNHPEITKLLLDCGCKK